MANRIILAGDNSGKSGGKIVISKLIDAFLFQQEMKLKLAQ